MDVAVVGGGPGGLYLSILLKRADPRHRVRVLERNGPDDTFGWGVVFSDETLEGLEEADPESYAAITARFARWEDIDVHFGGRVIRSGGHGFAGIARVELLGVLQRRAAELGVELRHHVEIEEPHRLEADVVVAADGVNSRTRQALAQHFRPTVEPGRSRYMWLGTHRVFDAFTFIVREDDRGGVFQVHAYPFDARTSTFIVETDEPSWRGAGLDEMSVPDAVAWCERLFAPELDGHRLMTNKSSWIRFPTVTCETWRHGNVVLLGDSAHTAHFSIGSGTKLAMEDSIALAAALAGHPRDVPAALASYEAARRPAVARTQRTASHSQAWFEEIARYRRFEPVQFAFALLSRSKRVTHANLRLRDPAYVAEVDRWFADRNGAGSHSPPPPPMFTPLVLRGMTLCNRVVVSPTCTYSAEDGTPNDWHLVHLGSRAVGGAGLVIAEMTDVSAEGRITPGCCGMYRDDHVPAWARVVDFVHRWSDARIALQLAHAGRKGSTRLMWQGIDRPLPEGNWPIVSASPLPYRPESQVPRELTRQDMTVVRQQFAAAARRAAEAGFDMLELHLAHGYLLASFLSPLTNVRTDEYGGSLENRMRYPLEVFEAVREAWPADRPVSVRLSASDWLPGGFTPEDSVQVALGLEARGCDVIDVSAGMTTPESHPAIWGRMYQVPFSDRIRNEAGIPTMAVGGITSWDQVNTILAAGRADLCVLAREHLRDPYFTLHAAIDQGWPHVRWPDQYLPARPRARDDR